MLAVRTGSSSSKSVRASPRNDKADQTIASSAIGVHLMKFLKLAGKCVFAALFVVSGVGHFRSTETFMKFMPPYLPFHRELVLLSGVFELALGLLLLVPQTTRIAAWGLIALLIAVFPANIYMYQHRELFSELFDISPLALLLRLPLQVLLIAWAWAYIRETNHHSRKPVGSLDDAPLKKA
jgi:uncharacterized membrane protein